MQEPSAIGAPLAGESPISVPADALETAAFRRQMGHISRHSFVFFLGTIFTTATGYLFKIYLARALGAQGLGVYALGMTMVGLLGVLNSAGLPQAALKYVAAYRATGRITHLRAFLSRSAFLLLVSNGLLGGLFILTGPTVAARVYHTTALNGYFGLFALIMVLGALTTFLGQVLGGYKDVLRRTVITNFLGTALMIAITVGLIMAGWGLRGYIFAQVLSAAVVLGFLAVYVARLTPAGGSFAMTMFTPLDREVVSFSALAFGVGLLEFVMSQSDKVLVGAYLNPRDLGIYAVASALVAVVAIVLQSINQIFSPTIAELYASGQHATLARIFQTLTKWCLGLTLPLVAVMIVFAPAVMRIFGRDFEIGWPILVVGTLGQLVNCGVGSVGYMLQMSGHQKTLVKIEAAMAVLMLVLGFLLIPRWGILGAAVAAAINNIVSNIWYLRDVRVKLKMSPYNAGYLRLIVPLLASLVILLLEKKFLYGHCAVWILVLTSLLCAYAAFVGTAAAMGLDSDDRIIFHAIVSRLGITLHAPWI